MYMVPLRRLGLGTISLPRLVRVVGPSLLVNLVRPLFLSFVHFLNLFGLLAFGTIANDGVGTLLTERTRGRGRHLLHAARVRRQTEASPTRRLPSLPPLISLAEIHQLREQVDPVSLSLIFCLMSF